MTKPETKWCGGCQTRHPISDFTEGQAWCKVARKKFIQDLGKKNIDREMPDDYMKFCKKCDTFMTAKGNFHKDKSRPDGYMPHCKQCKRDMDRGSNMPRKQMIGLAREFRKKLLTTIFRTVKDQNRSIVRQMVEDFKHEGEPISFAGREWQISILNDMRPNVVSRKPSQVGLTWVLERWIIAILLKYSHKPYKYTDHTGKERSRFIEGIYSFETRDKASNWSKVRLEKIKEDNPTIQDTLSMSKTESVMLMRFGRTSLHLVGRSKISGVLTIAADIVVIDEKDRDQNPSVSNQIGSRTLESPFMNTTSTKGLVRTISTPEVSGTGISLQMEHSTYEEWEIKCVKCGTFQVLSYPDCIGNFYEKGDEPPTDDYGQQLQPYWRCQHCHEPIDWTTIGLWSADDPDHYENARWTQKHPNKFNNGTGAGVVGYQVPFATATRSAAFFLNDRDDPDHNTSYLWNHLIGLPYDDITKTLVPGNFREDPILQWGYSGDGIYVMGCDHHPSQGGFIVIWKQISNTVTLVRPEGRWCVVYLEHVKSNKDLWDRNIIDPEGKDKVVKGRLYNLIMEYNIDVCVVDVEPDTNEVEKLIHEFRFGMRVWSDRSGASQETFRFVEQEIDEQNQVFTPVCKIFEDKVGAIDYYFNKIRMSEVVFLIESQKKAGSERIDRDFTLSHTNLYKGEIEPGKGSVSKEKLASENAKEVYKKRVTRIGDHWVMASKFCCQATRIMVQAKRMPHGMAPPEIRGMGKIPGQ